MAISLIFLIFIPSYAIGQELQTCEECHLPPHPSGDYIFINPDLILNSPSRVSPDANFTVTLDIGHKGGYELQDVTATMVSSRPDLIINMDGNEKGIESISKTSVETLQWELRTGSAVGIVTINITVGYTAFFEHQDSEDPDTYDYTWSLFKTLLIKETPIEPSTWNLLVESGKKVEQELTLSVKDDIENVTVSVSKEIEEFVEAIVEGANIPFGYSSIGAGEQRSISLNMTFPEDTNITAGYILITWSQGGVSDQMFILVTIAPSDEGGSDARINLKLIGRITGLLSLAVLVLAMFSGGVGKRMKKMSNKVFRSAKVRSDFHCALCYEILALSIFHGVVLWAGPYYNVIWDRPIVLGMLSAVAMGVVAINGLLQKWISRRFGYRVWKYIHLIFALAALGLSLIHGLKIGTDIGIL